MIESVSKGIRKLYNKFIHSIAFIPALMGAAFLALAIVGIELDSSGVGQKLNNKVEWLQLNDAATAREIVATIAAGVISLTVFSFSMVMLVMTQAASQITNRMLDNIIGDKVQKNVLGFYTGTIIYSLFLLTTINETKQDAVPVLSIYMLLGFTVFDIFLFIYFLHYVTQSIRYGQLIQRTHKRTIESLKNISADAKEPANIKKMPFEELVLSGQSGYFQRFSLKQLLALAKEQDIVIEFLHAEGTYILKDVPFLCVTSRQKMGTYVLRKLFLDIDFYYGQEIRSNAYYGFRHLMEIAVKALSPAINDPGTAVLSLNALADLLTYKMQHTIPNTFKDSAGETRIITKEPIFEDLFDKSVVPIWNYGNKDKTVQDAMAALMTQLKFVDKGGTYHHIFNEMLAKVEAEKV